MLRVEGCGVSRSVVGWGRRVMQRTALLLPSDTEKGAEGSLGPPD